MKTAKEELRTKSAELANVQKQLAQEQKAHAKALKELNALKATHAKMKRKVTASATELETLRQQKRARTGGGKDAGAVGGKTKTTGTGAGAGVGGGVGGESNAPALMPEIVLLDGPTGKCRCRDGRSGCVVPPRPPRGHAKLTPPPRGSLSTASSFPERSPRWGIPAGWARACAPPPLATTLNVNGTMRRLQPVCAQALPWSTSFIGCQGIKCDDGHDFTELFLEDGSRNAGNRRTTPLEVEHPKDVAAFHARSTNCPWAKPNLQVTLEKASDPMALHALLNEIAPKKALKVKRVDGQCAACYAAHVALAARLRAKHNAKPVGEPAADEVEGLVEDALVDGDGGGGDDDDMVAEEMPRAVRSRRGI